MIAILETREYSRWFQGLRDRRAQARIYLRLDRLAAGNAGDTRAVGNGVVEMRIDYGPGYRIYYTWRGDAVVLLLVGGDKRTQSADISKARHMARSL